MSVREEREVDEKGGEGEGERYRGERGERVFSRFSSPSTAWYHKVWVLDVFSCHFFTSATTIITL